MINTVIFDLGMVLVDYHPIEGIESLGFSPEAVKAFEENIFGGLWESCDARPISKNQVRELFAEAVPGFEKEVDLLLDHTQAVTSVYSYSKPWILDLKARGYQVYILSNFGQVAFEQNSPEYTFLENTDGHVVSYQVSMLKPNREIYACLADKYGIRPDQAVFIDDRPLNIQGAVDFGFHGLVFQGYDKTSQELELLLKQA